MDIDANCGAMQEDRDEEEASKSLQLLHMIKEHFACPSEEEDTEENWKMRELIDRLTRELN